MLRNYLKTCFRHLLKHKTQSVLNILGLTAGMACFFVMLTFIQNELSFNRFHTLRNRIHRVTVDVRMAGAASSHASTPAPLAEALTSRFPAVEKACRMEETGAIISSQGQSYIERNLLLADPSIFEMFTFPLLRGEPATALGEKRSLVMTERMAEKYFGRQDPLGQPVTLNGTDYKVTAVARNVPENSDIQFDGLLRFDLINEFQGFNYLASWGAYNFSTYVLLSPNVSPAELEDKVAALFRNLRPEDARTHTFRFLPLADYHQLNAGANYRLYVTIFFSAALLVLLLACLNFMNLAVAQSAGRTKEVGLRKVLGAERSQLARQFLGESLIFSFLALPLALGAVALMLPAYNRIFGLHLQLGLHENWPFLAGLIGITILVGVISGSYPALYASAIQPVLSLRGTSPLRAGRHGLRNALLVFQYAISILLIIGTVVIHRQLQYVKHKDMGFTRDGIINVLLTDKALRGDIAGFKAELLQNPRILAASGNTLWVGGGNNSISYEGQPEPEERVMHWFYVDADFLKTFEIPLVEGRNFIAGSTADAQTAYLLNETAVKSLGWSSGVGKRFEIQRAGSVLGVVVGVMKNFHFASLHRTVEPLALCVSQRGRTLSVRVSPEDIAGTIDFIRRTVKKRAPLAPFEYYFLDSQIDAVYKTEERTGQIFNHFAILSVFIACLGLFALTSGSLKRRTREIGIRKVLGASAPRLAVTLAREFTGWVLASNLLAWPLAYWGASLWLRSFAYRPKVALWIFPLAGLAALILAGLTVSLQTLKAASANPTESLRTE